MGEEVRMVRDRGPATTWSSVENHDFCFAEDNVIISKLMNRVKGNIFIDLGCLVGGFTTQMATEAKKRNGKVYSIDLFGESVEPIGHWEIHQKYPIKQFFIENMTDRGLIEVIEVIQGNSVNVADRFKNESVDFIWLDTNHDYELTIKELPAWYPKLKIGGIIGGHDWCIEGVPKAVKEFFKEFEVHQSTNGCWSHIKKV